MRKEGLEILNRSREGFTKLGQEAYSQHVAELIRQVEAQEQAGPAGDQAAENS